MNQDTVSGSYDFLYREYSIQGRWPSPDPAGLAAVDVANPQSLNRYAYVLNNPLALIDPLGLQEDGGGAGCWRGFSVTEMIGRDAWGNPIYRQSFLGVTNVPCSMGGVPLGMEVLPAWLQKKFDKLPDRQPQIGAAPPTPPLQPCRIEDPFLGALEFTAKVGLELALSKVKLGGSIFKNQSTGETGTELTLDLGIVGGKVERAGLGSEGSPEYSGSVLGLERNFSTGETKFGPSKEFLRLGVVVGVGAEVSFNYDTFKAVAAANQKCRAAGGR